MKKYLFALVMAALAGAAPCAAAPLKIAAALPDLGAIASYIGGDKVEVFSIGRNSANPHAVEVLPSYMIKVSRAALYLKVGLALDQWSDAIIDGSRNGKLLTVDCSAGVAALQKPAGKVDASMGDVHPEGNPHYWLDPANGVIIAGNVLASPETKGQHIRVEGTVIDGAGTPVYDCTAGPPGSGAELIVTDGAVVPTAQVYTGGEVNVTHTITEP